MKSAWRQGVIFKEFTKEVGSRWAFARAVVALWVVGSGVGLILFILVSGLFPTRIRHEHFYLFSVLMLPAAYVANRLSKKLSGLNEALFSRSGTYFLPAAIDLATAVVIAFIVLLKLLLVVAGRVFGEGAGVSAELALGNLCINPANLCLPPPPRAETTPA